MLVSTSKMIGLQSHLGDRHGHIKGPSGLCPAGIPSRRALVSPSRIRKRTTKLPHRNHRPGVLGDLVFGRKFIGVVEGALDYGAVDDARCADVAAPGDGHRVAPLDAVGVGHGGDSGQWLYAGYGLEAI